MFGNWWSLAKLFANAKNAACGCIPGSDYSHLKRCVMLAAFVLSLICEDGKGRRAKYFTHEK